MNNGAVPPAPVIRRLVPADWAALRAARLAGLEEAPYAFASTLDRELAFTEQAWRDRLGGTVYFGATATPDEPGLLGVVAGFPDPPPSGPAAGAGGSGAGWTRASADGAWHLVSMWVSPAARGSGIAGRLVTAMCDHAAARGAAEIALWVTDANHRARAFYQRAGFRFTGERQPVRPDESDHWEERMLRDLASYAPATGSS